MNNFRNIFLYLTFFLLLSCSTPPNNDLSEFKDGFFTEIPTVTFTDKEYKNEPDGSLEIISLNRINTEKLPDLFKNVIPAEFKNDCHYKLIAFYKKDENEARVGQITKLIECDNSQNHPEKFSLKKFGIKDYESLEDISKIISSLNYLKENSDKKQSKFLEKMINLIKNKKIKLKELNS
jgi:hypothetical protein